MSRWLVAKTKEGNMNTRLKKLAMIFPMIAGLQYLLKTRKVILKSLREVLTTELGKRYQVLMWESKNQSMMRLWHSDGYSGFTRSWKGPEIYIQWITKKHGLNSMVQKTDQGNFPGNAEDAPLTMTSSRTDLNYISSGNDGRRNNRGRQFSCLEI